MIHLILAILALSLLFPSPGMASEATHSSKEASSLIGKDTLGRQAAVVRTEAIRMILDGVEISELRFNAPGDLCDVPDPSVQVFHPDGGNAHYPLAPADVMADGKPGRWVFSGELDFTDPEEYSEDRTPSPEIMAFLIGISEEKCLWFSQYYMQDEIRQLTEDQRAFYSKDMVYGAEGDYAYPAGPVKQIANEHLLGMPAGCFQSYDRESFVYFYELNER